MRLLLALSGALPWLLATFSRHTPDLRPLFKDFCHQIPERTLTFFGTPMVVCSRCAGIYAGIALGAVTPSFVFMARHGRLFLWVALFIVLSDVFVQNYLLHSINHALRITTGFIAGWTASAFLFSSIGKPRAIQKGYGEN